MVSNLGDIISGKQNFTLELKFNDLMIMQKVAERLGLSNENISTSKPDLL